MSETLATRNSGFYGKLPAKGDFVGFGLPPQFVTAWDEWLQDVLTTAGASLGAQWPVRYMNAPIWRFALDRGACSDDGFIGILMVSVDSVGRFFPLTISTLSSVSPITALGSSDVATWFERAEAIALGVLDEDANYEGFLKAVGSLKVPEVSAAILAPSPNVVVAMENPIEAFLPLIADQLGPRVTLWWTSGAVGIPAALLRCEGLPTHCQAVALFDGQWGVWGWNSAPTDSASNRVVGELYQQGHDHYD